jgi:acyl-CoA thioester hydrolase
VSDQPSATTPRLSAFPFQTFDKIRYADTDRQGHVNNAAFATFIETGRVEFLYDPNAPLAVDNGSFVIASLTLRFAAEVNWPGRIDIGTAVTKLGKSSLYLYQGLFQADHCVATAETVIVQMDDHTRRSAPLSDTTRAFLERHMLAT